MGRLGISLIAAIAAFYGLSAVATAGTTSKPYSVAVTVSPNGLPVPKGSTNTYSFAITDQATTQGIGSAEIVPPNGFTIVPNSWSLSGAGMATLSASSNCPLDQVSPTPAPVTCLIANNLSITPSFPTETITFQAATSCAAVSPSTFGLQVQQANQFNGKPGNQSGPLADPAALNVTVSGSCTLQFVTQPADANPGAPISNQSYTPPGAGNPPASPIEVEALDGTGQAVANVPVTLAIASSSPDPGQNAVLAGAPVTSTGNNGIASFGGANIAQPGEYVLQATAPGFPTADSNPSGFLIGSGTVCTATCSANASDPKNGQSDTLTATTTTTGDITIIVGLDTPFCSTSDGMSHADDVTTVSANGLTAPAAAGIFGKTLQVKFSSKLGPGHFEVCWTNGGPPIVLGPCPNNLTQPVTVACLIAPISKDQTQNINEDILLPEGDLGKTW